MGVNMATSSLSSCYKPHVGTDAALCALSIVLVICCSKRAFDWRFLEGNHLLHLPLYQGSASNCSQHSWHNVQQSWLPKFGNGAGSKGAQQAYKICSLHSHNSSIASWPQNFTLCTISLTET